MQQILRAYFGFEGRTNRRQHFVLFLSAYAAFLASGFLFVAILVLFGYPPEDVERGTPYVTFLVVMEMAGFLVEGALITRRFHDVGVSGRIIVPTYIIARLVGRFVPVITLVPWGMALLGLVLPTRQSAIQFGSPPRDSWWPDTSRPSANAGAHQGASREGGIDGYNLTGLIAKFAKADGVVRKAELRVVNDFFIQGIGAQGDELRNLQGLFTRLRDSSTPFDVFAQNFAKSHDGNLAFLTETFYLLVAIAAADGAISADEMTLLKNAARHFRIADQINFEDIRKHAGEHGAGADGGFAGHDPRDASANRETPEEVLGVSTTSTDDEVRSAYRKKCKEYHPDLVASLGPKIRQVAEEELKRVNEAYSAIKRKRGW